MDMHNIAVAVPKLAPESLEAAVARARALGFTAITFGGTPADDISGLSFLWDDLDDSQKAELLAIREQFSRAVIHAPYVDMPLVSVNPLVERESLRQILASVRAAGALNLETVTIHTGLHHHSISRNQFVRRLVAPLRLLGEAAAACGTRICVENWQFPADPDEHSGLLEAVDHPAVGATVDLGHIAYWYRRDGVTALRDRVAIEEYNARLLRLIDRLGDRIWHIHAHDVTPAPLTDHNPIGTGIIDYEAVLEHLGRIGFDGLFMIELREGNGNYEQALIASRDRLLQAMPRPVAAVV